MESDKLTDTSGLEKSVDALRLDTNNGTVSTLTKDTSFSRAPLARVSSLEDVIEEDYGGNMSPINIRSSRSPRRRLEDEQYIHSIPQVCRSKLRRRSDPGRVSVSPLRSRVRIEGHISEDGDYDSKTTTMAASRITVRRSYSLDPSEINEALPVVFGLRSRSRSPHTQAKFRTQRSRSLPGIEFELGEAIGALAVRNTQTSPELIRNQGAAPRRRRSVSVEMAPLEAILEENATTSKSSRRYSTPNVKSPPPL
ncbi:hypothetical protein LSH36_1328g00002 [Paralvinella palmiformis]|uniref:Uncharacterized protein n=1 Tax=Paralvinella palmiformis TaxID=53620 RepID=A0AAD9IU10_9ANNE|nr:hypothetical protein LSH36_1328g00002 [Paralvinella palmiformis]